ncbi:Aldehyde dehydrogenase family [Popillia japonica]|uniref:Succinate-semialdehyde dehydrogenase, mitochondrial n=1 Tax=Popillia japonica TaxID=7064 RepID=A0AAW1IUX1_POPJA
MGLLKDKAIINGEWVSAKSKATFTIKSPVNGEVVGTVPHMDASDAELAINAASEAFKTWQISTGQERAILLRKWLELIRKNSEELAKILTAETGKTETDTKVEIMMLISGIEYFAEEAIRIQGEIISSPVPGKKLLVERQPLGVVGLISPWNFPLMLTCKKIATALAAGCTCVVKPPEDAPLSTLSAVQLAHDAGIPKGVINVLTCDRPNASQIGKILCDSKLVAGISFTGSTVVGKILYQQCAPHIKRISLELGGNSPFIVFNSANIDQAVEMGVKSKFFNCGQACIAANRFLIQEGVYDEFVQKLAAAIKSIVPGKNLGPLINSTQFKRLCGIMEDAKSKGANVVLGGQPAKEVGELFYQPTLVTGVTPKMQIYTDEIFGPVASVIKFKTEEEGVAMANDTEKGLGAFFYSQDVSQIFRVSRLIQTGLVWINDSIFVPDVAPFGGIKESGIGKEGSHHSIDEFTYMKFICIGNL